MPRRMSLRWQTNLENSSARHSLLVLFEFSFCENTSSRGVKLRRRTNSGNLFANQYIIPETFKDGRGGTEDERTNGVERKNMTSIWCRKIREIIVLVCRTVPEESKKRKKARIEIHAQYGEDRIVPDTGDPANLGTKHTRQKTVSPFAPPSERKREILDIFLTLDYCDKLEVVNILSGLTPKAENTIEYSYITER